MRPARVEIAAPNSRPTHVVRPPFAVAPESKRAPKIENQEISLKNELITLEEGTKARNREFYRQIEEIEDRGKQWEGKLKAEIEEQRQTHKQLFKLFDTSLSTTIQREKQDLIDCIELYHREKIPPQESRMTDNEKGVETFVHETIPAVVDRQSGIVSRKLQKAHDTFDIENAKVMKREQKIVSRFRKHVERTAQAFEDERATRTSKFSLLGEEISDNERINDRQEEKLIREVIEEIAKMRAILQEEIGTREKEDNTLLDTMLYAQQRLQESILRSFGAEAELSADDRL